MAPASAASTSPRQRTARTSTRCSTRIFFTLASRSGTTRIVYDLSKDLLLLPLRLGASLRRRAAGRLPTNRPPARPLPADSGPWVRPARWARGRPAASLRPVSDSPAPRQHRARPALALSKSGNEQFPKGGYPASIHPPTGQTRSIAASPRTSLGKRPSSARCFGNRADYQCAGFGAWVFARRGRSGGAVDHHH